MNLKNLFFFVLLSSTSSFSYASYSHPILDQFPEREATQQDYPSYISNCRQWIESGVSKKEGQDYPHQASFKKLEENLDKDPPFTKVEATRFLRDGEEKINLTSYPIILPHLIQASSENLDQRGYHYLDTVLYRPIHQQVSYKLPTIAGVEGLEHDLNYTRNNDALTQEVKKAAFHFTVEPENAELINGYYRSRFVQKKPHSYLYSSGTGLFLMQYQKEFLNLVNHEDIKATFKFLFDTPHKIVLKPGSQISDINLLKWQGIFHLDPQQSGQWQKVKTDLSIDTDQSYTLTSAEPGGSCFQTIELDPNVPNAQILQDLRLSSLSQLIESLDFRGRAFEPAEQQDLITLLTSMPQLKSLNLTKEETTKDYNTLVPTLVTLTNLKSLNLTNGQITEENRQKLAALAGLELIPAAQPVGDVPAQPALPSTAEGQPPETSDTTPPSVPDLQAPGTGDQAAASSTPDPEGNPPTTEGQPALNSGEQPPSTDSTTQPGANPGEQSPTGSTTQQVQTVVLKANPESTATDPIRAPEEKVEPDVDPTGEKITPVAPVKEAVNSSTEVPAVTLNAGTTDAAQAASDPSTATATPADAATTDATPSTTETPTPAADTAPDPANPFAAFLGQSAQPQ